MKHRWLHSLVLPLLLQATPLLGQRQFDNWYFGQGAAIDFGSGSPVVLSGSAMYTNEGSATMSDPGTGQLLFYTDGVMVWDSTNTQMPNGFGLSGDVTSTQSALIVQKPSSNRYYYVFTVPADGALTDLRYSIVDMSLNGGRGDVSLKNSFMAAGDTIAEKATAIRHCNGRDWWIIFHALGNNNYLAWKLDSNGLANQPVVSAAGSVITTELNRGLGWLSSSNDATRLVLPSYSGGTVDLVDFDNATGMVSNPVQLTGFAKAYGTAFSPNDQVLYVTDEMSLAQFDLSSGVPATIQSSRIDIVTEANMMRAIRLAPDGVLYVAREWEPHLGTVSSPNTLGFGCTYNALGLNLGPGTNSLGLPNTYSLAVANACNPVENELVDEGFKVQVFPQPAGEHIQLLVTTISNGTLDLTTLTLHGQCAWRYTMEIPKGRHSLPLDLGHLPAGAYILRATDGMNTRVLRIMKE